VIGSRIAPLCSHGAPIVARTVHVLVVVFFASPWEKGNTACIFQLALLCQTHSAGLGSEGRIESNREALNGPFVYQTKHFYKIRDHHHDHSSGATESEEYAIQGRLSEVRLVGDKKAPPQRTAIDCTRAVVMKEHIGKYSTPFSALDLLLTISTNPSNSLRNSRRNQGLVSGFS